MTALRFLATPALLLAACGGGGSSRPDDVPDAGADAAGPPDAASGCDPAFAREAIPDDGLVGTQIRGLHGTAPDDVWAAPHALRIYHRDAAGWREGTPLDGSVNAVFALHRTNAYAVGPFGYIGHWDGNAWRTEQRADSPTNTILSLDDVHALSDEQAWAVGEQVVGQGQRAPLVMRRQADGTWERVPVPPAIAGKLHAVWVESPTRRWVAGESLIALHDDTAPGGKPWMALRGAVADVAAIDGQVWALRATIDDRGPICRYLGDAESKFTCIPFPGAPDAAGKAFAVVDGKRLIAMSQGPGARLAELRDGAWAPLASADLGNPLSIWGTGDQLWIGGVDRISHRACRP